MAIKQEDTPYLATVVLRRGWIGPNMCTLCEQDRESKDHIMFNCAFSRHVWEGCAKRVGININFILDNNLWDKLKKEDPYTLIVRTLFAIFCWNILAERNSRTFNSAIHSIDYYIQHITRDTALWPGTSSDAETTILRRFIK